MLLTEEPRTPEEEKLQSAAPRVFYASKNRQEVVIVIDDPKYFFRSFRFRKYKNKEGLWHVGKPRGPKVSRFLRGKIYELALRSIDDPALKIEKIKLRAF